MNRSVFVTCISAAILTCPPGLSGNDETPTIQYQGHSWISGESGSLDLVSDGGREVLRVRHGAFIRDVSFRSGTIELDLAPTGRAVAGISLFGTSTGEDFDAIWLNPWPANKDEAHASRLRRAIVTKIDRVSVVLTFHTREEERGRWTHIKMVSSGDLCQVFLNGDPEPAFIVANQFDPSCGETIGVCGHCLVSNLKIKPATSVASPGNAGDP